MYQISSVKEISERHDKIINIVKRERLITLNELASVLKISKITIRRDINKLAEEEFIKKIPGGAGIIRTDEYEPPYLMRYLEMKKEKEAIGIYAASLIKENEIISLDVGSTLLELAKNIPEDKNITVITNWIPIINVLAKRRYKSMVFTLGGQLNLNELSVIGGFTNKILDNFNIDVAFIGVGGISLEMGFTDYNIEEIQVKKQVIDRAKKVIVIADHSKFTRVAHIKIGGFEIADQIITSEGLDAQYRMKIEEKGIKVLIAK